MFSSLNHRESILLLLFIVISIISVYYIYFYQPGINKIKVLKKLKSKEKAKLDQVLDNVRKLPVLQKQYKNIGFNNNLKLTKYRSSAELLEDIRIIGNKTNIKILNFTTGLNKKTIEFKLNISGMFNNILHFLDGLKGWNKIMDYNKLEIVTDDSDQDLLILNLSVVVARGDLK